MRDLARLQRLRWWSLIRAVQGRAMRGGAGFLTGLFAAIKVKIAASLSGKLVFAALIAVGFACPSLILWTVTISVFAAVAVALGYETAADGSWGCCLTGTNERRERLVAMISERKNWLRNPEGPMPPRRSDGSDR